MKSIMSDNFQIACRFCGSTELTWSTQDKTLTCDECRQTTSRFVGDVPPKPQSPDLKILDNIRNKFRSGNDVPADRAWITAEEWAAVERLL